MECTSLRRLSVMYRYLWTERAQASSKSHHECHRTPIDWAKRIYAKHFPSSVIQAKSKRENTGMGECEAAHPALLYVCPNPEQYPSKTFLIIDLYLLPFSTQQILHKIHSIRHQMALRYVRATTVRCVTLSRRHVSGVRVRALSALSHWQNVLWRYVFRKKTS